MNFSISHQQSSL